MLRVQAIGIAALLIGSVASVGQEGDRPSAASALGTSKAFPALTKIYEASGVRDNAGAENNGVATTIYCTNLSPAKQRLRIAIRNLHGLVVGNVTSDILSLWTVTRSTHGTILTESEPHLSPGLVIDQGVVIISATTPHIACTVQVLNAATGVSIGDLHLVRFNPRPNTQE